jgi:hypothetical protein
MKIIDFLGQNRARSVVARVLARVIRTALFSSANGISVASPAFIFITRAAYKAPALPIFLGSLPERFRRSIILGRTVLAAPDLIISQAFKIYQTGGGCGGERK